MSSQKFDDRTFTLNVSFDDEAKAFLADHKIDLEDFKENFLRDKFFKIVSLILRRATYDQHKLEIVFKDSNSDDLDILITRYITDAHGSRIWNSGYIKFSIDHIYSPGLMLHELGHYIYGLGDEYKGCMQQPGFPRTPTKASIMEYSFGNITRFRKKGQKKEYKVLGGFEDFWEDYQAGNNQLELLIGKNEVVTDFCHDSEKGLKHNPSTDSQHNTENAKASCWTVMTKNADLGIYSLEDPFKPDWTGGSVDSIRQNIETKIKNFEPYLPAGSLA